MSKLYRIKETVGRDGVFLFKCPGCGNCHQIRVKGSHPVWSWNEDMEKPTFQPSYLIPTKGIRCHSYIEDGKIRFLNDCDHSLAGQTVELPEWEVELFE